MCINVHTHTHTLHAHSFCKFALLLHNLHDTNTYSGMLWYMHAFIYIYIYIYTHTHTHIYIHTHSYIYMYAHMHVMVHAHVCLCVYDVYMWTCIHTYVLFLASNPKQIRVYTHTFYVQTCTTHLWVYMCVCDYHVCMHIQVSIYVCVRARVGVRVCTTYIHIWIVYTCTCIWDTHIHCWDLLYRFTTGAQYQRWYCAPVVKRYKISQHTDTRTYIHAYMCILLFAFFLCNTCTAHTRMYIYIYTHTHTYTHTQHTHRLWVQRSRWCRRSAYMISKTASQKLKMTL